VARVGTSTLDAEHRQPGHALFHVVVVVVVHVIDGHFELTIFVCALWWSRWHDFGYFLND
jgi:hypothetical protein